MYIHAGAGKLIRGEEIIGVFDMDGHVDSEVNRGFLKSAEKSGVTSSAGSDLPRSFIVVSAEERYALRCAELLGRKSGCSFNILGCCSCIRRKSAANFFTLDNLRFLRDFHSVSFTLDSSEGIWKKD